MIRRVVAFMSAALLGVLMVSSPAGAATVPGGAVCATHTDAEGRGVYLRSDLPDWLNAALDANKAPGVPALVPRLQSDYKLEFYPGSGYVKAVHWYYVLTQGQGVFGTSGNGTPIYQVNRSIAWGQPVNFHETTSLFYWWAPNANACSKGFVKHAYRGTLAGARAHGFPA